jgi:hypothetical protein
MRVIGPVMTLDVCADVHAAMAMVVSRAVIRLVDLMPCHFVLTNMAVLR